MILLQIFNASIVPAWKNIHVIVISPKTMNRLRKTMLSTSSEIFIELYSFFFWGASICPATTKAPLNNPHTTKCHSAPCHNPLIRKTIITLIYFLIFPLLLPPRGI